MNISEMGSMKVMAVQQENSDDPRMRMVIEYTSPTSGEPVFAASMHEAAQADEYIAALTGCREFIWGPMPRKEV